ncbi:hypothetical protein SLEP1_g6622 [Rubroshorea leprosula]|uniref:Uncharacterized protein n=1 Tax=Rubroshorea leprosula TaxID=152421 RepID=A0AAV5HW43_9ROSI|nr:hypothetical protein SLEP1_g6622 [Rubroshorea leprosula]
MAYNRQQAISAQIRSEELRSKATMTTKTAETNDCDNEPAPAVRVGAGASAARAKPRAWVRWNPGPGFDGTQALVLGSFEPKEIFTQKDALSCSTL